MILVTGGYGFIGSNYIKHLIEKGESVINIDKLTYAGDVSNLPESDKIKNFQIDINDKNLVYDVLKEYKPETIIHFAADSHVDNSIQDPSPFIVNNILGTYNLLEALRKYGKAKKIIIISTDEVYGSTEYWGVEEDYRFEPNSPYSASKASAECLAYSYYKTFDLPIIITRSSNVYGPNQQEEKLIPKIISKSLDKSEIPIYGNGKNKRWWLSVYDLCNALDLLIKKGKVGEKYNIKGDSELSSLQIAKIFKKTMGDDLKIKFVADRKAHDKRYNINDSKIRELGFRNKHKFKKESRNLVFNFITKLFEKWKD